MRVSGSPLPYRYCCASLLLAAAAAQPISAQQGAAEQYLFRALNAARQAAGLPALAWSDKLSSAAARHAEAMQKEDCVAHQFDAEADLPERVASGGVRFSVVAENLGVAADAQELHQTWIESPDHRDNILEPQVNVVGIAVRESAGELWAVEDFAALPPPDFLQRRRSK